jgi:hypothetical protein
MINTFQDLKTHIGHKIVCVAYGNPKKPVGVCIECETCNEVLVDLEEGQTIGKDDGEE